MVERQDLQQFGGATVALRAYQHWHPYAAIYTVTYRGRTVWMTSKQQAIWHEVQKYWKRGKRDTLARIATIAGCSTATVSRFLRRLDLWRFIDLATIRGRNGGTYVFTRRDPYNEKPRRWTVSMRERARMLIAQYIRHNRDRELAPARAQYRASLTGLPKYPPPVPEQGTYLTGSTDATYWKPIDIQRRKNVDTYGSRRRVR